MLMVAAFAAWLAWGYMQKQACLINRFQSFNSLYITWHSDSGI